MKESDRTLLSLLFLVVIYSFSAVFLFTAFPIPHPQRVDGNSVGYIPHNRPQIGEGWLSPSTNNQTMGATMNAGIIPAGSYIALGIQVALPSLLYYYSSSNVSVDAAVVSQAQLALLNQSGQITPPTESNSLYLQEGTSNANAILLPSGNYSLLFYAASGSANVTYSASLDSSDLSQHSESERVSQFVLIAPNQVYKLPLRPETLGSPSNFTLFGISNSTVYYNLYEDAPSAAHVLWTYATTVTNISSPTLSDEYALPPGYYTLTITNPTARAALVYYDYSVAPDFANPFARLATLPMTATGLSSFGISNQSGAIQTYRVDTDEVVGLTNISAMEAYDASSQLFGTYPTAASLQLNSMILATNKDGTSCDYWAQDVVDFVTASSAGALVATVFNSTNDAAVMNNQSVTSLLGVGGAVSGTSFGLAANNSIVPAGDTIYMSVGAPFHYTLPFALGLVMKMDTIPGKGFVIDMGMFKMQNGSAVTDGSQGINWFDRVLVSDSEISSVAFHVAGDQVVPSLPPYYDAEFVFGGQGNGESTNFTEFSATMALLYDSNTSSGSGFVPFPSYYDFAGDTAESAVDLQVSYLSGDLFQVSAGQNAPAYLGAVNETLALQQNTTSTTTSPQSTSAISTLSLTTSTKATSVQGANNMEYTWSSASLEVYLTGAMVAVAIIGTFFVTRRVYGSTRR